jgi:thiamine biosynthesis lipoprotein
MKKISKKKIAAISLVLVAVLLMGVFYSIKQKKVTVMPYSVTREYFGTVMTITLYGADEKQMLAVIERAFEECARLENIFSAKLPDSELSRLNTSAYQHPSEVSEELFYVISTALSYNELSGGCFDISMGKLIKLWGIGTQQERVPSQEELEPYAGVDGCQYIVLDEANKTIMYTKEDVELDLGGIAKGYAADRIKEYILENRRDAYGILDFGGNIMTVGQKPENALWNIGITNPLEPSDVCAVVSGTDLCVVTSGNYERYFIQDGVRYHHILDPATGYPAERGIISATIIGTNSTRCDALSTACYIMGIDAALDLINSMEGVEAVFIDDNGTFYTSDHISEYHFNAL